MKPPGGRTPTKGRDLFSVLHVYYLNNCNVEHLGAGHMPSLQTALAIATPGQPPWYRILEMTRQRRPGRSNCMHHDPSSTHEALRAFCMPPTQRNLLLSVCDAKHLVHKIISLHSGFVQTIWSRSSIFWETSILTPTLLRGTSRLLTWSLAWCRPWVISVFTRTF